MLVDVADAPTLRADFGEIRATATAAIATSQASLESNETDLAAIQASIESLEVPQSILDHDSAITNLYKNHERYLDWMRTSPEIESKRQTLETKSQRALAELGKDPTAGGSEQMRIGTTSRIRIHELIDERSALMQAADEAAKDLEEKRRADRSANLDWDQLPASVDTSLLARSIDKALKLGDFEPQLALKEAKADEMRARGIREIDRLTLWNGTLEELESLPVPSVDSVNRFASDVLAADTVIAKLQSELVEHEDKIAEAASRLNVLEMTQDVPTEDDLDAMRKRRDASWSEIESTLKSEISGTLSGSQPLLISSMEAYQVLVLKSDEMSDRLRREAERVAEKTRWINDLESWKLALQTRKARLNAAIADRSNLQSEWRDLRRLAAIEPQSPVEMKSWLESHRKIAELAHQLREQCGVSTRPTND